MEQIVNQFIEKVKSLIEKVDQRDVVYAKILQQKKEATLPESEVQKVTEAVKEAVQTTQCAMPDTEDIAGLVASSIVARVANSVRDAVVDKVKTMPIQLEHHHTHTTSYSLAQYADVHVRKWIYILSAACVALALVVAGLLFAYYSSDVYWAQEYTAIHNSEYATPAEKEMLWKDAYVVGALPIDYQSNPDYFKAKIRQNKQEIQYRRKEADDNDGICSTKIPLER